VLIYHYKASEFSLAIETEAEEEESREGGGWG